MVVAGRSEVAMVEDVVELRPMLRLVILARPRQPPRRHRSQPRLDDWWIDKTSQGL